MINFLFRKAKGGGGGQWVLIKIKQPRVPGFFFAYPLLGLYLYLYLQYPASFNLRPSRSTHIATYTAYLEHNSASLNYEMGWTSHQRIASVHSPSFFCSFMTSQYSRTLCYTQCKHRPVQQLNHFQPSILQQRDWSATRDRLHLHTFSLTKCKKLTSWICSN